MQNKAFHAGVEKNRRQAPRHRHTRRRVGLPHGFTLIELLVVISIVSLLISLLLPALSRARDTARTMICLSNHRQLSVALQVYLSDTNGVFPGVQDPSFGYDYGGWQYQIGDYISIDISSDIPVDSVYSCPEEAVGILASGFNNHWRYAMNHDLRYNGAVAAPEPTVRLQQVVSESQCFAFIENGRYNDLIHGQFLEYGLFGHSAGPSIAGPAHGGKGLAINYLDGHGEFWAGRTSLATYENDRDLPWTHTRFWGKAPPYGVDNGSLGASRAAYDP